MGYTCIREEELKMDFYKEVGRRIKYYRELKGLTLEYIGNKIGVGKSTVRKYQDGEIKVDHNRLSDIADVLGIDVALLYGDEVQFEEINVPLYGEISCGDGVVAYEHIEDYVVTPTEWRSEEHTSELQSRGHLVCRLLLEK